MNSDVKSMRGQKVIITHSPEYCNLLCFTDYHHNVPKMHAEESLQYIYVSFIYVYKTLR